MTHKKTDEGYPIFRSYLEEENDKPYYSMNTLSFYYEDMARKQKLIEDLAKAIAGYDQTLTGNLQAIEQQVAERFDQWDEKLKTFDGSVMDLLQEWVDDGTMDHIVDSSIVDRKLEPLTSQLAETEAEAKRKRELEDLSPTVLSAIEGGEGTTFNLLSIPQDNSVTAIKTDFLKQTNLYDGNFIRGSIGGNPGAFTINPHATAKIAKIKIKPNTTYSVIREPSDRFKITTDTVENRGWDVYPDGEIQILILSASDVRHATFTTGPNDIVLYVNYTNSDINRILQVVEGVQSKLTVTSNKPYYKPNENLDVYSKGEVDELVKSEGKAKKMKVLSIGNSFSVDSSQWLFDIAQSAGVDIVVGAAYDSSGSLQTHWDKSQTNGTITAYNKWTPDGGYTTTPNALLIDIIADEDWDIITYQQVSADSGKYETFQPYLNNLHQLVESLVTNPKVRYGFHMTWAYATGDSRIASNAYGDQLGMFNAIRNAYLQAMEEMDFDIIVPSGTAIQNARTNPYLQVIGNDLTRDGTHLDMGIGRYIAGLTFFETLFGGYYDKDVVSEVSFYPEVSGGSAFLGYLSRVAVKNAVLNPFTITEHHNKNANLEEWAYPTLLNGWIPFSENYGVAYYKNNSQEVVLSGYVKGGSDRLLFTLPVGYRPSRPSEVFPTTSDSASTFLEVTSGGEVRINGFNANGNYSLSAIRFRVS